MKTIAIDFDGVIHAYSRGYQDGSIYDRPIPGAIEAIDKLLEDYKVYIYSTRDPDHIVEWFKSLRGCPLIVEKVPDDEDFWNKGGALGVSNRKLPAIAYIDDRGIRFTNWTDILNYF